MSYAFLAWAAAVYGGLLSAAIAWARHCYRRPYPERDPHFRMHEVPHHAQ